jgi:hypothetical protein
MPAAVPPVKVVEGVSVGAAASVAGLVGREIFGCADPHPLMTAANVSVTVTTTKGRALASRLFDLLTPGIFVPFLRCTHPV